jgi:hypothetical protein
MQLCVDVIEPDRWGLGHRFDGCLASLRRYGGNARDLVPALRKIRDAVGKDNAKAAQIDKLIADIQADTNPPKLQTVAEFIKNPAPNQAAEEIRPARAKAKASTKAKANS